MLGMHQGTELSSGTLSVLWYFICSECLANLLTYLGQVSRYWRCPRYKKDGQSDCPSAEAQHSVTAAATAPAARATPAALVATTACSIDRWAIRWYFTQGVSHWLLLHGVC